MSPLRTRRQSGSIPACAGEPRNRLPHPRDLAVYPRVCGGTILAVTHQYFQAGLSPRVRGNPADVRPSFPPVRSIPACAGEPPMTTGCAGLTRVYPRVCGGTSGQATRYPQLVGLSPRVRGNQPLTANDAVPPRSIPACAGEPPFIALSRSSWEVYPRVCGGTARSRRTHSDHQGLSPRVRGNRLAASIAKRVWRSIPACAGEPL